MRTGILGGTFDPIHTGHLFIAEEARGHFGLDQVLFIPNRIPPHKEARRRATPEQRFEMVEAAIQSNPAFAASRIEIDREGPSYTVDTLSALKHADPEGELFFISGFDTVAEILTWRRPKDVLRMARFVAVTRTGYDVAALDQELPQELLDRIDILAAPVLEISSTDIRERAASARSIRYLVPDAVVSYIVAHGLYGLTPPPPA